MEAEARVRGDTEMAEMEPIPAEADTQDTRRMMEDTRAILREGDNHCKLYLFVS